MRQPPSQKQQQQSSSLSSAEKTKQRLRKLAQNVGLTLFLLLIQIVMYRGVMPTADLDDDSPRILSTLSSKDAEEDEEDVSFQPPPQQKRLPTMSRTNVTATSTVQQVLPKGFQAILRRAKDQKEFCRTQVNRSIATKTKKSPFVFNETIQAKLPPHGILKALSSWKPSKDSSKAQKQQWNCQLPPETECKETQVTAIFMAHKPQNIDLMAFNIQQKLFEPTWQSLIKEMILVYNGPVAPFARHKLGQRLVWFAKKHPNRFRIFYALEQPGFSNHLMNRYHPMLNVTTKGILFYDDDGPYYTYPATLAAFELWKRNANAQVGALGRMLDLSPRQSLEREQQRRLGRLSQYDKTFVSHCQESIDHVEYNYKFFPNFGSNMVLPSSSFLHVNYLCYLWHPALTELRKFIASHPVFPDDMAVSLLVSQLSGRSPRTYPYRLLEKSKTNSDKTTSSNKAAAKGAAPSTTKQQDGQSTKANADTTVKTNSKESTSTKPKKDDKKEQQSVKDKKAAKSSNKEVPSTAVKKESSIHLKKSKKLGPDLTESKGSVSSTKLRRRLLDWKDDEENWDGWNEFHEFDHLEEAPSQLDPDRQRRRRLLWTDVSKEVWSGRRSHAATNLVAYFGSINAGGVGWCLGTPYQKKTDTCVPELAEVGMLPWMNEDNTPKSTCP